jgi:aminopeptidase N
MKKILVLMLCSVAFLDAAKAQLGETKEIFTHADTLRGSLNPERTWWDVLKYDLEVMPDFESKTIVGKTTISYKVTANSYPAFMQIDLQDPLIIDSVLFNNGRQLAFTKDGNAWHVNVPKQKQSSESNIVVYYHGKPREAVRPPWDGGWIWKKDAQGSPWMSVACQGLGASVWYPCKDHQSDEPDNGASLTMIVPDTLVAVGNGRMKSKMLKDGLARYTWEVLNPINNYNIIPYIGKYVNWTDTLMGEKGKLDLSYWVLDYEIDKAKKQFEQVKPMLRAFEYWMGPYPFYEDGYKLVQSPHLGMEHQSAVAYGNKFQNGYLGRDLSGTGWGLKWDFIIIHESGHEWFANNVTSKDIADMWVHEGFTNYSETLFTDYYYGADAGNAYNYGTRNGIRNDINIIGKYGVNKEGSGDMYPKSGNMLQSIRHAINNDEKWRQILRGLNKTFYHQTVTTKQVEDYVSKQSGIDFSKVFDQYLRTVQIPQFDYYYSKDNKHIHYKWSNCVAGFNLPVLFHKEQASLKLLPTISWKKLELTETNKALFDPISIEKQFYVHVKQLEAP